MKRRIAIGLGVGVLTLVGAFAFLLIRPDSQLYPLRAMRLLAEGSRVRNFREMDRIFPTRTIRAGGKPFRFARAERPLDVTYTFDGTSRRLDDFLEAATVTGFLAIEGDAIVSERYFQGADEDSRHTSFSVAKSFTATLIGIALGEGLIESLGDPVTRYVPGLAGTGYDGASIRDVLQMSSGVRFDETYSDGDSDINRMIRDVYTWSIGINDWISELGSEWPPGRRFRYASCDTQVLGWILRNVTGRPVAAYLEEKLWKPLGMERDGSWVLDADDGMEMTFWGLNMTLRDYAKLGRLYLHQGRWDGQQILPPGWVREATTPSVPHVQPEAVRGGLRGYQYQWWVPGDPNREYFASGVWGQHIWVSEPDDVVIVRTSVDPDWFVRMGETIAVFRAVSAHLGGRDAAR